ADDRRGAERQRLDRRHCLQPRETLIDQCDASHQAHTQQTCARPAIGECRKKTSQRNPSPGAPIRPSEQSPVKAKPPPLRVGTVHLSGRRRLSSHGGRVRRDPYESMMPRFTPSTAACVRSLARSFERMFFIRPLTVSSETESLSAISLLACPPATSWRTA